MRNIGKFFLGLAATALLASAGLAVGCGSDDNPTPVDPTKTDTGTTTDTGADTGTTTDTGTSDAPSDAPADAPWSPDSGTCFPGKPTKTVEFINACTKADKLPAFDKKKLTKLKSDGTLPPLP